MRLLKGTKQSEILFHHRFPTSTDNVRNACHPFSTKDFYKHNYVMVHNGVIWNDLEIAKLQANNGVHYVSQQRNGSFNDSEVLLYDIADVIEGKKELLDCEGSIAFIMVQLDKKGNKKALYFGRNSGSPLKIKKFRHGFSLTSEGDGELISTDTLFRYDYKTGKFSEKPLYIPSYSKSYIGYGATRDDDNDAWYEKYCEPKKQTWVKHGDCWVNKTSGEAYDKFGNRYQLNSEYETPRDTSTTTFTEMKLDEHKDLYAWGKPEIYNYKIAIQEVKNALMYDMSYATDVAIQFGEYLVEELTEKSDALNNIIITDEATQNEWEEVLQIDTMLEILHKALSELKSGQMQLALKSGLKELTV